MGLYHGPLLWPSVCSQALTLSTLFAGEGVPTSQHRRLAFSVDTMLFCSLSLKFTFSPLLSATESFSLTGFPMRIPLNVIVYSLTTKNKSCQDYLIISKLNWIGSVEVFLFLLKTDYFCSLISVHCF